MAKEPEWILDDRTDERYAKAMAAFKASRKTGSKSVEDERTSRGISASQFDFDLLDAFENSRSQEALKAAIGQIAPENRVATLWRLVRESITDLLEAGTALKERTLPDPQAGALVRRVEARKHSVLRLLLEQLYGKVVAGVREDLYRLQENPGDTEARIRLSLVRDMAIQEVASDIQLAVTQNVDAAVFTPPCPNGIVQGVHERLWACACELTKSMSTGGVSGRWQNRHLRDLLEKKELGSIQPRRVSMWLKAMSEPVRKGEQPPLLKTGSTTRQREYTVNPRASTNIQ